MIKDELFPICVSIYPFVVVFVVVARKERRSGN